MTENLVQIISIEEARAKAAASVPGRSGRDNREQIIPMRKAELTHRLLADEGLSAAQREPLTQFCQLLDATLHYESHGRLARLKAAYAPLDPDATDAPTLDATHRDVASEQLFHRFHELLTLCNYRRLSRDEIAEAMEAASDWGVNLHVDFAMFQRLDVYCSGEENDRRTRRRLLNGYRPEEVEVPIYRRLAVIFQLRDDAKLGEVAAAGPVYLKLFKNVPKQDIDMLLPGAQVRMSLLDRGRIILPTLTGVAMTAVKLLKGAVLAAAFAGFYGMLAFLGLVGGVIGYGVKSFFGYQRTKEKYHLHLTRSLYYQNLANGSSVLFQLLDEAQEQEYREAALAYFHLWRRGNERLTMEQLDEIVEEYLRQQLGLDIDFEVDDAVAKLQRLGLAVCHGQRWQAVPLEAALRQLDRAWDSLFDFSSPADSTTRQIA